MTDTQQLTVLVTGSTGLVGASLTKLLEANGHTVRRLVRRGTVGKNEFHWDLAKGTIDPKALEGADAVVHLAGESIAAGRWTDAQKERIRKSRIEGTRLIADAVRDAKRGPKTLLTASAIGFYGDRGDEEVDESSATGTGFLAEVCREWEAGAQGLEGMRSVQLRFGVILNSAGGALKKMLLPFKLGLGGRLGSGKQWMSWIALTDVVRVIEHALNTESLSGAVNVVAPGAVRNSEFTKVLGRVLGRPTIFPAPAFAMRLALGEMADELLLNGQHVLPKKLLASGFEFSHRELEGALRHELG